MDEDIRREFERFLSAKRRGGVPLHVGVSRGVWMGGFHEEVAHEAFVYIGPEDAESEGELTFFADRAAVKTLIQRLERAAAAAWGDED